jgi:hypothetical protein
LQPAGRTYVCKAVPGLRDAAVDAWWFGQPPERVVVFSLRIATALFVEWNLEDGLMTVRWTSRHTTPTTSGYP